MMIAERHDKIMALVEKHQRVSVRTLQDLLLVSVSTLRRDLETLEQMGLIRRVHGGVELVTENRVIQTETSWSEKRSVHATDKRTIAKTAVQQLHGGEIIYLDAGTTTSKLIPLLGQLKPAPTVVTNSVHHAAQLADLLVPVIIIGGLVKLTTNATIGAAAVEQINRLSFDVCFVGINSIDQEAGISTPDLEEAAIKQAVLKHSNQRYILADSSKFGQTSFAKVADLADVTIITDQLTPQQTAQFTAQTTIIQGGHS